MPIRLYSTHPASHPSFQPGNHSSATSIGTAKMRDSVNMFGKLNNSADPYADFIILTSSYRKASVVDMKFAIA